VDQLLLTPDQSPAPLLDDTGSGTHEQSYSPIPHHSGHEDDAPAVVLPDNGLPLGFVPLSPIPSLTNFKMGDHDPHRMHEQYLGSGYQVYAAPAVIPDTAGLGMGMGMGSGMPFSSSLLFSEPPRPPTAAGSSNRTTAAEQNTGRRRTTFVASPAPLDRPISLFSDG
jgi:hypothetical protein